MWFRQYLIPEVISEKISGMANEGLHGWISVNQKYGSGELRKGFSKTIPYRRTGSMDGLYAPVIMQCFWDEEMKSSLIEIADLFGDEMYCPYKEIGFDPEWTTPLDSTLFSSFPFVLVTSSLNPKGAVSVAERLSKSLQYQGEQILGSHSLKTNDARHHQFGPRNASIISRLAAGKNKLETLKARIDLREAAFDETLVDLDGIIKKSLRDTYDTPYLGSWVGLEADNPGVPVTGYSSYVYSRDSEVTQDDIYNQLSESFSDVLDRGKCDKIIFTSETDFDEKEASRFFDGLDLLKEEKAPAPVAGPITSPIPVAEVTLKSKIKKEDFPSQKDSAGAMDRVLGKLSNTPVTIPPSSIPVEYDPESVEDESSSDDVLSQMAVQLKRMGRDISKAQKLQRDEIRAGQKSGQLSAENAKLQKELIQLAEENSELKDEALKSTGREEAIQRKVTDLQSRFDGYKLSVTTDHEEDLGSLMRSHERETEELQSEVERAKRREAAARQLVATFDEDDLNSQLQVALSRAQESEDLFDLAEEENTSQHTTIAALNRKLGWYRRQNSELSVKEQFEYVEDSPILTIPDDVKSITDVIDFARNNMSNLVIREGVEVNCAELDGFEKSKSWMKKIFNYLASMNEYCAENREDPVSIQEFLSSSNSSYPLPSYAVAIESAKTSSSSAFTNARMFKLPSGESQVFLSHLRIDRVPPGPRIHFYDDSRGSTGVIHIGYVGPHLPTTNRDRGE